MSETITTREAMLEWAWDKIGSGEVGGTEARLVLLALVTWPGEHWREAMRRTGLTWEDASCGLLDLVEQQFVSLTGDQVVVHR